MRTSQDGGGLTGKSTSNNGDTGEGKQPSEKGREYM